MGVSQDLQVIRRRLRKLYLGKAGIHGIGVRQKEHAVCVYVSEEEGAEAAVLKAIKKAAAPYKVIVVREERPRLT